jgi:hypothetical protein
MKRKPKSPETLGRDMTRILRVVGEHNGQFSRPGLINELYQIWGNGYSKVDDLNYAINRLEEKGAIEERLVPINVKKGRRYFLANT